MVKRNQRKKGGRRTEQMAFRLDPELRQRIEEMADLRERTMSWLIESYIKMGLSLEGQIGEERWKKERVS